MSETKTKLLTAALQRAAAINNVAQGAHANKKSCMAMNHRIQIANEFIKAAYHRMREASPKSPSLPISDNALTNYCALLDRMKEFLVAMSKRKPMSKLFYALRFRDEFDAHMREFDVAVLELNLGIALRTEAQLETDRDALEEDMTELKSFRKELQNGIDTLGGQLAVIRQMIAYNQPMEDILASVEIDFRDVVDITPPETRRGRTFPVHKRSWLAQEVAEKPLGYFGSQDMLDMLKNEVAILKKLDRCNYIVKFMGVTNRNNNMSIIMEWLPGGDLATALTKENFDWEQKLFIAADIARGLLFLHEVGIIHKNLRAKNVVLTRFYQAKITNFRQSRLEDAATRPMSDPFSFVRWLAPEKMMPKETRYGPECDIYSFGMLLFEIASNHIPYKNLRDRELPELIVLKDYYETVPDGTPTEYGNIMSACWSHDPKLRPTISQVLLILRDACHRMPNGQAGFGGLAANMNNPAPLFAIAPPSPIIQSDILPISPPMTPVRQNGFLTPDIWKNPYVNKRHVEEKMEEMRASQLQQQQQSSSSTSTTSTTTTTTTTMTVPSISNPPIPSHHQHQNQNQRHLHTNSVPPQSPAIQAPRSPRTRHSHQLSVPTTPSATLTTERAPPIHITTTTQGSPPTPVIEIHEPTQEDTPTSPKTQPLSPKKLESPPVAVIPDKAEVVSVPIEALPAIVEKVASAAVAAGMTVHGAPPVIPTSTKPQGLKIKKLKKPLDEQMNRMSLHEDQQQQQQRQQQQQQQQPCSPPTSPPAIAAQLSGETATAGVQPRQSQDMMRMMMMGRGQTPDEVGMARQAVAMPEAGPPDGFTMAEALHLHENSERERAWRVFKYYAERNEPEGIYWTAYYKFHGEGGQAMDRRAAFDQFRRVTEFELPTSSSSSRHLKSLLSNAHFYQAVCYLEGQGVSRSQSTGFKHMEKAADLGNAFAQYLIGDAYAKGSSGVIKSLDKRNMYWQAAAKQREPRAMEQCRRHGIAF